MTTSEAAERKVAKASVGDTMLILKDVVLPTLAKGPLIRRRKVVTYAEKRHLDDKATRRLQAMRRKYGAGPLLLAIPFRHQAVLLSAPDVQAVLENSPKPFAAASLEKQSALDHFEPDNVLASKGIAREQRRKLNEETLETGCAMHSLASHFAAIIAEEMDRVSDHAIATGTLDWDGFFVGWMRMVRRIVLGDEAADDGALTDLLEKLRYRANYAFLRPKAPRQRKDLLDQLEQYVDTPSPQSLVGQMARFQTDPAQKPHHQLPQYLFAFDPGAMATFRTLAMLSVDKEARELVEAELSASAAEALPKLPVLRACLLESLRLWPTTPAILRETSEPVYWSEGHLDQGTQVLIFTPFLHRDDETLPKAHVFDPLRWLDKVAQPELGLVPFSHGPVQCPAVHFVPMVTSLAMRRILTRLDLRLTEPNRLPLDRLPGTLDNFTLNFAVAAQPVAVPEIVAT
jgi:cytochrome P450